MARSVDDRIVAMHFNNEIFERKISDTLKSLDTLQKSLDFSNSVKGLSNLDVSGTTNSLVDMGKSVDTIASRFNAMGAVAFSVIQNLTTGVLGFAKNTVGDILDPIIGGGRRRAENIDQAKFQFRGLGLDVEKAMASAKEAVLGTAFGLDEAAKAAAVFGASGIKVGAQLTGALRGVAGAAAQTGASFSEIAGIFTQSAGTGVVNNQDLQQFATRGLNAAAAIAPILGKTEKQVHELASAGKLDFQTFADAMDQAFGKHATEANQTYSGSLSNMHAALARVGAAFISPALMNQRDLFNTMSKSIDKVKVSLDPAINAFTYLSNLKYGKLTDFINGLNFDILNPIIKNFTDTIVTLFRTIEILFAGIRFAFAGIFPTEGAASLLRVTALFNDLAHGLQNFVDRILPSLVYIFALVFSTIKVGYTIIKDITVLFVNLFRALIPDRAGTGIIGFFGNLAKALFELNTLVLVGAINNFFDYLNRVLVPVASSLGDFIGKIFEFLGSLTVSGSIIQAFTDSLKNIPDILAKVIGALGLVGGVAKDLFAIAQNKIFSFFSPDDVKNLDTATGALGRFHDKFKLIGDVSKNFSLKDLSPGAIDLSGLDALGNIDFSGKAKGIGNFIQTIKDYLGAFGEVISGYVGHFKDFSEVIQKGLIKFFTGSEIVRTTSPFEAIVKVIDSILVTGILLKLNNFLGGLKGLVETSQGILKNLSKSLQDFGKETPENLATQILKIGAALFLLALSLKELAGLDGAKLATAFAALTAGMTGLFLMIKALDKSVKNEDGVKKAAESLILMSIALRIMASAISVLAKIDPVDLGKGLIAAGLAVAALAASTKLITVQGPGMLGAAASLVALSLALVIMAGAIKIFSEFDPSKLAVGLAAAIASLLALGLASSLIGPEMALAGPSIVLLAGALIIMAEAVKRFGDLSPKEIVRGLGTIFLALTAITSVLSVITNSPGFFLAAAAIPVVAVGLLILVQAIKNLGEIKGGDLAKGLAGLFFALTIISVALIAMEESLPGAVALVVTAGALLILAGVIATIGNLDIKTIAIALGTLTVTLLLLAAAGALLAPELALLGAAMILVGAGFLLFGIGVGATVAAFVYLVTAANNHAAEFIGVLKYLAKEIPGVIATFAQSIADNATAIAGSFRQMVGAIQSMIITVLDAIIQVIPKFIDTAGAIIDAIIVFIGDRIVEFVDLGFKILTALLDGLLNNIGSITVTVIQIIGKIVQALTDNMPQIVDQGGNLVISFLRGLANKIGDIISAGKDLVLKFLLGIASNAIELARGAADILIAFLDGLTAAIREKAPRIRESGLELAKAILSGITGGLSDAISINGVVDAAKGVAKKIVDGFKSIIPWSSPSPLFIKVGQWIVQGLGIGMDKENMAENSAVKSAERIVRAFSDTLAKMPEGLPGLDTSPVITPVLDLTQIQVGAKNLNDLMQVAAISPTVSIDQASIISATPTANPVDSNAQNGSTPTNVTFEQTINSPIALSTNDIYRNTKSQIALAKEELGI